MIKRFLAFVACASLATAPLHAADLHQDDRSGARRSGAVVGTYLKLPLDRRGGLAVRPQAGLSLSTMHSYRDPTAPNGREFRSEGVQLRLVGADKPALFVGGRAFSGKSAKTNIVHSDNDTIMAIYAGVFLVGLAFLVITLKPCGSCGDD